MPIDKRTVKDPEDILDFGWDWGKKWMAADDHIIGSDWELAGADASDPIDPLNPDELTINSHGFLADTHKTFVWLTKGVSRKKYVLTNTIATYKGRTKQKSMLVHVAHN